MEEQICGRGCIFRLETNRGLTVERPDDVPILATRCNSKEMAKHLARGARVQARRSMPRFNAVPHHARAPMGIILGFPIALPLFPPTGSPLLATFRTFASPAGPSVFGNPVAFLHPMFLRDNLHRHLTCGFISRFPISAYNKILILRPSPPCGVLISDKTRSCLFVSRSNLIAAIPLLVRVHCTPTSIRANQNCPHAPPHHTLVRVRSVCQHAPTRASPG